jgi:hypothetical protein
MIDDAEDYERIGIAFHKPQDVEKEDPWTDELNHKTITIVWSNLQSKIALDSKF